MTDTEELRWLRQEVNKLKARLAEVETRERNTQNLSLRDGTAMPDAAAGLALIYVDESSGTVRVVFSDGVVEEFVTTVVVVITNLLDFSDNDMSMYLGII